MTARRKIAPSRPRAGRSSAAARSLVVGNWKMQFTTPEAIAHAAAFARIRIPPSVDIVVCPSYTALAGVRAELQTTPVSLGAQDVFWQAHGEYTGEVAAADLRSLGCRYVIIGHSERRRDYGETDEMVNRKVFAALGHGLSPIICVGESVDERSAHRQNHIITRQVHRALHNVMPPRHGCEVVVAYEPLWAVGAEHPAAAEQALVMAEVIRQALVDVFGPAVADRATRVLYGGSVFPDNVNAFVDQDRVRGVLLGRSSTDAAHFRAVVERLSGHRH